MNVFGSSHEILLYIDMIPRLEMKSIKVEVRWLLMETQDVKWNCIN